MRKPIWDRTYKDAESFLNSMAKESANPTYGQLQQLERLLNRTLRRIEKRRKELQKAE